MIHVLCTVTSSIFFLWNRVVTCIEAQQILSSLHRLAVIVFNYKPGCLLLDEQINNFGTSLTCNLWSEGTSKRCWNFLFIDLVGNIFAFDYQGDAH
jgi:hypothetical protein